MTPERFREIQDATGLTSRDLGDLFHEDDRRIRRMAGGREEIPPPVATWMEDAMAVMAPLFARAPNLQQERAGRPTPPRHVQHPL